MSRLVYGSHPVTEVIRRRKKEVKALLVAKQSRYKALIQQVEKAGIPINLTSETEMDALCETTSHQGIIALVGEFPYLDLEDLLGPTDRPPLLLVADSIMDPQNLGAIIRSSLVLGATGVVIPKKRAAQITPAVVRVSAGASEYVPCAQVTNIARSLDHIKQAGIWVAGAVESGGQDPAETDLSGPLALVLGNEHKGIRPLVLRQCDILLTIPSMSDIASLNVSAAAVALLYEVSRQRRH